MAETMTGYVAELGGAEIGKTGKEKPRKVVLKKDLGEQYGKTFRVWSSSYQWDQLQDKKGQLVTLEYVVEERQGGPSGSYTQNMITDVLTDVGGGGNGVSAGEVAGNTPVTTPADDWSVPKPAAEPAPAPVTVQKYGGKKDQDDVQRNIIASWAITNAVRLGWKNPDEIRDMAHKLIVLKDQIAAELAE